MQRTEALVSIVQTSLLQNTTYDTDEDPEPQ